MNKLKKYTVQIHYPAEDSKGRKIRATCPYWCEAASSIEALELARKGFPSDKADIGFVVEGHSYF